MSRKPDNPKTHGRASIDSHDESVCCSRNFRMLPNVSDTVYFLKSP